MSLELLDQESEQLYTELKATVMEHAEKVAITFDALVRIRDGRLYRAEFKTFSAFCQSVGMNTRKAYRLLGEKKPKRIAAKTVTEPEPEANNPTETKPAESAEWPDVIGASPGDAISATEKVAAMMQKLSLKPVIDVRAEQYRTHTPIPPMDRPEEKADHVLKVSDLPPYRPWTIHQDPKADKIIASTELKAWAVKRRAANDATSEDDAAWADYIAQQMLL